MSPEYFHLGIRVLRYIYAHISVSSGKKLWKMWNRVVQRDSSSPSWLFSRQASVAARNVHFNNASRNKRRRFIAPAGEQRSNSAGHCWLEYFRHKDAWAKNEEVFRASTCSPNRWEERRNGGNIAKTKKKRISREWHGINKRKGDFNKDRKL